MLHDKDDTGRNEWEALLDKMKMARVAHPLSEGEKVGIRWAAAELTQFREKLDREKMAKVAENALNRRDAFHFSEGECVSDALIKYLTE